MQAHRAADDQAKRLAERVRGLIENSLIEALWHKLAVAGMPSFAQVVGRMSVYKTPSLLSVTVSVIERIS